MNDIEAQFKDAFRESETDKIYEKASLDTQRSSWLKLDYTKYILIEIEKLRENNIVAISNLCVGGSEIEMIAVRRLGIEIKCLDRLRELFLVSKTLN